MSGLNFIFAVAGWIWLMLAIVGAVVIVRRRAAARRGFDVVPPARDRPDGA